MRCIDRKQISESKTLTKIENYVTTLTTLTTLTILTILTMTQSQIMAKIGFQNPPPECDYIKCLPELCLQ